ncbi:MAG: hypothetical protein PHH11_08900 [Methylomonas sp.]|nr:hypothetical protein [Methylomonas sp.]
MPMKIPDRALLLVTLPASLMLVGGIYSMAMSGQFHFDDVANLEALAGIKNLDTAFAYIFTSEAGPLGRPLALATFAAQYAAWPKAADEFLLINILIHLLNGALLAWFGWLLAKNIPSLQRVAMPFALTFSLLWLLQPLLASASLLVVQRMATLCATFVLLGLIGYLLGRRRIADSSDRGWPLLLASLVVFGTLAIFTKESGLLLPVYVWILETTLLPAPAQRSFVWWRRLLYLPLLALFVYLALQLPSLFDENVRRTFNTWQRLLTEGPILWQYLHLLLLPRASELGPFHDDWQAVQSLQQAPEAGMAWLGWFVLIGLAIAGRRRWPWLSFSVAWFLLGHVLESTLINLELYFEHRNYIRSIGVIAAISATLWQVPDLYRRTALGVAMAYACLLGFVLHEVTTAWGNPRVASQLWATKHPDSERAQQFLANSLLAQGDLRGAYEIIGSTYARHPERLGLGLQTLQLRCELKEDVQASIQAITPLIPGADLDHAMAITIEKLLHLSEQQKCPGLNAAAVHGLIDALLQNKAVRTVRNSLFRLHHLKARLYFTANQPQETLHQLEAAFAQLPDLDTGVLMVGLLAMNGLTEQALEKIGDIKQAMPANPVLRRQWTRRLDELERDLSGNH